MHRHEERVAEHLQGVQQGQVNLNNAMETKMEELASRFEHLARTFRRAKSRGNNR